MDEQEKAFEKFNRRKAAIDMGNLEAEIQRLKSLFIEDSRR